MPAVLTDTSRNVTWALERFARGGFVIVDDHQSRGNEGDLMIAAEFVDTAAMRFMLDHTSGTVAVPMPAQRLADLALPQMVQHNAGLHETAFTVSVDLLAGCATGISAQERARTVRALADPAARTSRGIRRRAARPPGRDAGSPSRAPGWPGDGPGAGRQRPV